jgi:hypothetical protein
MAAQRKAKVEFPTAGDAPSIKWVEVLSYPQLHTGIKSCNFYEKRSEIAMILGYARHDEGIDTIDIAVVAILPDPKFDGLSYGLALALADKRSRFSEQGGFKRIIATGVLGAQGKILRVEGFRTKLALAIPLLDERSVFVFPKENINEDPTALDPWNRAQGALRAVTRLDELSDLWQPEPSILDRQPRVNRWHVFLRGAMLGFLLVILTVSTAILYDRLL